jgi:hypothetical protein
MKIKREKKGHQERQKLKPKGSNFQVTTALNEIVSGLSGRQDVAQHVGGSALANAKAGAVDIDQNRTAMSQNSDIGTFTNSQFAELGALVFATADLRDAELLATFRAAQRGTAHFMFMMRG